MSYDKFGPGYAGVIDIDDNKLKIVGGELSAFDEQLIAQLTPVAGWKFNYGAIADMVTTSTTGSGETSTSGGRLLLKTTAASSLSASVVTKRVARYTPGMGIVVRFTAVFTTGVAGSQQIIGIGDSQDGLFFGFNGATFGVMRRRAGNDTWVSSSNWNGYKPDGDGGRFTIDQTNGNIFQIRFQWLGYGAIRFYIEDPESGKFRLVHTIKYANTTVDTSLLNPTLPLFAEAANTSNNTAITLSSPSGMIFVEGNDAAYKISPLDFHRSLFGEQASVSTEVPVLSVQAGTVLNGVNSRIHSDLEVGTFTGDGNKPVLFKLYKGGTVLGSNYSDYSAGNSTVKYDTAGTSLSGGTLVDTIFIGATSALRVDFRSVGIEIAPGEIITVTAQSSVAQTVDVGLNIVERF